MKLNGSQIIVECLIEQKADVIFGYPGGAVLNIYDELYKNKDRIRHIITAHEQAASHAADAYSRTTGKTGVVLATSGPGATNLVTGIATAYMDSVPMVALTGNVGTTLLGLDSFQEVDICAITKAITKKNYQVKDVKDLASTIREAFYIANHGRKGPVLIDIPKDVTAAVCDFEYEEVKVPEAVVGKNVDAEIEEAVRLIEQCKRPFIYAGGGVVSCNAEAELKEFVDLIDAPVSLSLMGQSAFDNTDARYIGMLGMHGTKTAAMTLAQCDLMIVLGSRFSDRVSCNPDTFGKGTKIIHIEIDPKEIGKNIPVAASVCGDISYVLRELNKKISQHDNSEWLAQVYQWKKEYALHMKPVRREDEVLPSDVIETLDRLTEGKAIITTEVGQHQMWAAQFYNFTMPRQFASSGGLGTMGYGLGAAIGCKVGNPDRTVVNIAGDGSFFMNCAELSSVAKHDLPIIEMVFDNNVLGMVRQWQRIFYGKRFSQTDIDRHTNMMELADAFGVRGFTIASKGDIEPVLKEALSCGRPCLIDVLIDKDINVLPMVPPGKDIYTPIMDIEIDD